mgnify:CR=1 FL=1
MKIKCVNKFFLTLIFLISSNDISSNQNFFGSKGANYSPSARFNDEGTLSTNFSINDSFRRANILAQPYEWLEVSIFYADIPEMSYSASLGQSYKDKGFNTKILLKEETNFLPQIALGFSDFVGTGLFSGEYLVFSKKASNIDYSFGLGWGLYSNGMQVDNPFKIISDSFRGRNEEFDSTIGELDFNDYFSGDKASIFGSIKYKNDRHEVTLEINPVEFTGRNNGEVENTLSKFYLTYSYNAFKQINPKIILGSDGDLNFSIDFYQNFLNVKSNDFKRPKKKVGNNFADLVLSIQENKMYVQDISLDEKNRLVIGVRQNQYLDRRESVSNVIKSLDYSNLDTFEEVVVNNYSFGKKITSDVVSLDNSDNVKFFKRKKNSSKLIYQSNEKFPLSEYSLSPSLRTMIASREGFLYRGLYLDGYFKHFFSENVFFDSKLTYSVSDNFDELFLEPVTTFPNQVRSDIKKYLNDLGDKISVERFEMNYLDKKDNHHLLLKAGIFELMFAGYGVEYLNINRHRNYGIGFEAFHVKKRDYSSDFNFLDYETFTGHINFYHYFDPLELTTHLSIGQYLAGDKGATFDFSKRFRNGLKFGFYFSLTDVSFEEFGEGSFDKGVYFQLPLRNIYGSPSTDFTWSPLTKDPAKKLSYGNRLFGVVERFIY